MMLCKCLLSIYDAISVVDPGFPVGGCAPIGGHGPLTQVLFGENVCENERIGFHRGCMHPARPPRSANESHNNCIIIP